MHIDRIELTYIRMLLKHPFETSFGRQTAVDKIIVAIYAEGLIGYGESPLEDLPYYSSETVATAWHAQADGLLPLLLRAGHFEKPGDLIGIMAPIRGHNMAKAGIEGAAWDLYGQMQGQSIAEMLGAKRDTVPVGVSIGVQESIPVLLDRIAGFADAGYRRIKIKIKPGWDVAVVAAIRERFPDISLMVDANSAYTLADKDRLLALDEFDLLMIEQPLAYDDLLDHATLQAQLNTPICLDESITTPRRALDALALGACRIINIKPARVGGISAAKSIHDSCIEQGIPVWCGGLLESGIGRAANLAVAALPGFTLPGDISATDRYWHEDISEKPFVLNPDGSMRVPDGAGLGVEVQRDRLYDVTVKKFVAP